MVSLRVLKEQQESEQRKQRVENARRLSAQVGVESARRYEEQKRRQDAQVRSALHNQWEREHQQQRLFMQCVAAEGTARQGEGMRNAAAVTEATQRRSQIESHAWDAEHVLEQERYQLALERQQIELSMRSEREGSATQRRIQVKTAAVNRSKQLLEQSRSRVALQASRDTNMTINASDDKRRRFASTMSISINVSSDERSNGPEAAKKHMEHREMLQQLRHEKAMLEQRKASDRAKQVVKEMKLAEEQLRLEEEQEAMLKESMAANAMRSALRPISATDFQEQEARKAQSIQRKTETEFEAIFLRGPWSADSIQRLHQGPTEASDTSLGVATAEERSYLAVGHVQLYACAFTSQVLDDDEEVNEGRGDGGALDVSVDAAPDPQSPEGLPVPTPKPSPSPPQHDDTVLDGRTAERVASQAQDAYEPVDSGLADTHSHAAASEDTSYLPLRQRQDKFLHDLEALQLRLAKATQNQRSSHITAPASKDVDTSGSTNLTAEGDLSISSMSSMEMSTRVACSADSSASQPETSQKARRGGSYGLTAEQLRASVMNLRKKQQSS